MSETHCSDPPSPPLALAQRVDEVCERFEVALLSGGRPHIEDYLTGVFEPERLARLHELIPLEVEYCRRHGETPEPEEYLGRFPFLDPAWVAGVMAAPRALVCEPENPLQTGSLYVVASTPSNRDATPHEAEAAWAELRMPGYEILGELGRGGMGVVYEARQVSLNRKVALKVLSGGLGLTPKAVQRFHREAEAAAKLHHTNIVPVYATGEENGTHFYAMELIDGPSLDHVIRHLREANKERPAVESTSQQGTEAPRSPHLEATGPYVGDSSPTLALTSSWLPSGSHYFDTVARMVAEVADALEYAHQQGVIHRDIKPSNLLLSPPAGVERGVRGGRLSINDFGLARMLEQPGMTMTGEFVGTPAYMSPEQITAGRAPLNHRTDIYSLGATLYELLTLERPFNGERRDEVIAQIMHKEPKSPRRINRKVPVDLETICLKCLEKDPDRRYQTAGAMAEDLRRYVNRFAISARRVGPVGRLVKWVRRRPAVAASLACVFLAVCVALVFGYHAHHAEQQRAQEQERHRLQLLDQQILNAYMVAASGDLKATETAIEEIEELGGSTGQVRLLRGMVYYFRGDAANAIEELEQAVRLLPESVAAHALLARAYGSDGQWQRGAVVGTEMESLSPSSPEDFLFKGHAQGQNGFANLDEGIRRRNSPLGRALRAWAWADRAHDTGEQKDLQEALADADAARIMVPDNPRVLMVSIYSYVVAAGIYQEANLPEKRKAALQDAARCVEALEHFIDDLPNTVWPIWFYYEETDEGEKGLKVVQRSFEKSKSSLSANHCAIVLYRQGGFKDALDCLDQRRQTDPAGDVTRAFVLAELDGGPGRALQEYEKNTRNLRGNALSSWKDVLLLLGEKDRAVATCQRSPEPQGNQTRNQGEEFADAGWQFARGALSEHEYLAKAGPSHLRKTDAQYQMGLFRLATGDRDGAREHFQKALGTRTCWSFSYMWTRMFLSRMEKDPKWPSWIK